MHSGNAFGAGEVCLGGVAALLTLAGVVDQELGHLAQGAALPDPAGLFNASMDAGTRRAIDIKEGESVDAEAFKALIRAAIARNIGG